MVTISPHISSSLTLPDLYSAYRERIARPTSGVTIPRLISQSKNVSPASPDQRVPSQSKAATSALSCNTESTNCCAAAVTMIWLEFVMLFDDNVSVQTVQRSGSSSGHQDGWVTS